MIEHMDLTNVWMNDSTVLAQFGHVLGAYAVVITADYFTHKRWVAFSFGGAMMLYALLKEFWYDATYEIPRQTFGDNMLDFSMYFLGVLLALAVVRYKKR